MKIVHDFNASVPSNYSRSLNRAIPLSPNRITLAEFGLSVSSLNSDVVLNAKVGIQSTIGVPTIVLNVYRNDLLIGRINVQTLAVLEYRNTGFQIIDQNPPVGYHAYRLTAEANNILTSQASVVGPISMAGTSYSPTM